MSKHNFAYYPTAGGGKERVGFCRRAPREFALAERNVRRSPLKRGIIARASAIVCSSVEFHDSFVMHERRKNISFLPRERGIY